ncbi:MAG: hypothetical protein U5K79_13720 [Cyclobacteriaceae bacterium]|nr:hypothetical protein [Cyclobacteriaceae bacterium]
MATSHHFYFLQKHYWHHPFLSDLCATARKMKHSTEPTGFFLLAGLILSLGIPLFPVSYQLPIAPLDNSGFFTLAVDGAATGQYRRIHQKSSNRAPLDILFLRFSLGYILREWPFSLFT